MDPYLTFLQSWLLSKIFDAGITAARESLTTHVRKLISDPTGEKWTEATLTDDQQYLALALSKCQPIRWRRWLAGMRSASERPIAIVGPSGTGKSAIATRLVGKEPNPSQAMSTLLEHAKLISDFRRNLVLTAPGSITHGPKGIVDLIKSLTGPHPPKVVCIVTCAGYHATVSPSLMGTFLREATGDQTAANLSEFLSICKGEEIEHIKLLIEACHGKIRQRIPSIITIVNKRDLWSRGSNLKKVPSRYTSKNSDYGKLIGQLTREWGLATPSSHDILPMYTFGGGFHPATVPGVALTPAAAEADAMVLRALVFYRYTEGSLNLG